MCAKLLPPAPLTTSPRCLTSAYAYAEAVSDDVWTVERHLEGKPEASVELFWRLVGVLEGLGPVVFAPSKSTVTFKGSRRGCAGARPTASGVRGYFDVQRDILASTGDPRILSVAPYTARLFVHHFQLTSANELDDTVAGWLAEAYAVGRGDHLR